MSAERILRAKYELPESQFKSAGELIWHNLQQLKNESVCLIDSITGQQLTVSELKRLSNSIAVALINRGITKTDKIAFYGDNTIQHSILRFATFFTGNTFLPLSPLFGKYEVSEEIKMTLTNVIFTSAEELHKFDGILEDIANNKDIKLVVVFDGKSDKYLSFEQLVKEGEDRTLEKIPHFDINPKEDMVLLIHTSGSTGRPKCAMISNYAFINFTDNVGNSFDRIIGLSHSFGHVSGTVALPTEIMRGSRIILFKCFDEELILKCIEKYRINILPVYPYYGRRIIEGDLVGKYDLSSLKVVFTGGASFPGHIAKDLIEKYAYSMSECYSIFPGSNPSEEFVPGNVGTVAPGNEVRIADLTTGESLGPGIDGEICIRGKKMFSGYFNNEKATKDSYDKDGWYRTGDIGHYDAKERLFITDRLNELINVCVDNHLQHISGVEIEMYLLTHKSIAEVVVIGVTNKDGNQWPRAYVVLKEGHSASAENIEKYVSETLAKCKRLLGGVVFIERIVRTSIGKVDRKYYKHLVNNEVID